MTDEVWEAVSDLYQAWCRIPIDHEIIEPDELRLAVEAVISAWDDFLD